MSKFLLLLLALSIQGRVLMAEEDDYPTYDENDVASGSGLTPVAGQSDVDGKTDQKVPSCDDDNYDDDNEASGGSGCKADTGRNVTSTRTTEQPQVLLLQLVVYNELRGAQTSREEAWRTINRQLQASRISVLVPQNMTVRPLLPTTALNANGRLEEWHVSLLPVSNGMPALEHESVRLLVSLNASLVLGTKFPNSSVLLLAACFQSSLSSPVWQSGSVAAMLHCKGLQPSAALQLQILAERKLNQLLSRSTTAFTTTRTPPQGPQAPPYGNLNNDDDFKDDEQTGPPTANNDDSESDDSDLLQGSATAYDSIATNATAANSQDSELSFTENWPETGENDSDLRPTDCDLSANDCLENAQRENGGESDDNSNSVVQIVAAIEPEVVPSSISSSESTQWSNPGVLAGVIGGAVTGLLFTVLLVIFIFYRLHRRDAGSYRLDEPRNSNGFNSKNAKSLAPLLPLGVDFGAPMHAGSAAGPPVAPSMYVLSSKNDPLLAGREYYA